MKRIFRSQKGMALMVIAMVISVMFAILMLVTTNYYQMMLNQLATQRNRIYALQVMQDMALLAQKANDAFVRNGNTCAVGPYTQVPAAPPVRPFCWDKAAVEANCVREPRLNTTSPTICIDWDIYNKVRLSKIEEVGPKNWWEKIQQTASLIYENRQQIAAQTFSDLNKYFGYEAQATELHWPAMTVPPLIPTLTSITCTDAGIDLTGFCKKCSPTAVGKNLDCLEIRVCLRNVGGGGCSTANDDEWFVQTIGIIGR